MAATITFYVMGNAFDKNSYIPTNEKKRKVSCFCTGLTPLAVNQQLAEVEA